MRALPIEEINRLSPDAFRMAQKHPLVLVLDNIRSRNNVGSVFRTADAFAVERLLLCGITPVPPHRDIHKTALGAEEVVAWERHPDTAIALQSLKRAGYKIIALEHTDQSQALPSFRPEVGAKYALVFGNEVKGVADGVLAHCDLALEIPQFGTKHSLNIGVSVGVAVWDIVQKMVF
ncbi:MAG: RNA methyltransferase [Bacteroidota bacterium]